MENDILDALEDLGYTGPLLDETCLEKALEGGPKSVEYTTLVEWISKEMQSLCGLEEHVNAIASAEDSSAFMLELSSFLKELGCCYSVLTEGHMSDRLATKKNRMLLLDFLLTELQAARMVQVNKPDTSKSMQVQLNESATASDLKNMLIALKFPKPPANITPALLFGKVETKLKEVLVRASAELIGKPLFIGVLSEKQWHQLGEVQKELLEEYRMRREMLIKRLDVTIQSFQWSERMKNKEDEIASMFLSRRKNLALEPNVHIADLLAAREDLAIIEKTSCASVRKNTQTNINKVIIGRVPDRGGRPSEQQPPPPEMPSWQQNQGGGGGRGGFQGGGGGGRGRGGGGDRGGRVQGGWNQGGGGSGGGGRGGYNQHEDRGYNQGGRGGYNQHDDRGYIQGGRGGYNQHDDRGYNQHDNRGSYNQHDNRGGYQEKGYQDRGGGRGGRGRGGWNRGGHRQDNYR